jgi:hypothetical protein
VRFSDGNVLVGTLFTPRILVGMPGIDHTTRLSINTLAIDW